jgi:hypothetical protein
LKKEAKTFIGLVAVAPSCRSVVGTDDMVVDPLGDEAARLVDRGFRVVDAVKGRAGPEGFQIPVAMNPKLAICGNDSTLTPASDGAELAPHPAKAPAYPIGRDRPPSGLPQQWCNP